MITRSKPEVVFWIPMHRHLWTNKTSTWMS